MTERARVVLLAGDAPQTNTVYHALAREVSDVRVIVEAPVPRAELVRRRMKRLGFVCVAGQLLLVGGWLPLLRRSAGRRIEQICREYGLDESPIPVPVTRVPSVNSPEAREALHAADPTVVVVQGTRIIGQETLTCVDAPFINMHAGITPAYRGVHGGYWALSEGRPELAGTTVHLVDEGIDTGSIVAQATFTVTPADSFVTYPYLHLAAGLPILVRAVRALLDGALQLDPSRSVLESRLHSHPTLWSYTAARICRGVR
jgi:hypothetical protein